MSNKSNLKDNPNKGDDAVKDECLNSNEHIHKNETNNNNNVNMLCMDNEEASDLNETDSNSNICSLYHDDEACSKSTLSDNSFEKNESTNTNNQNNNSNNTNQHNSSTCSSHNMSSNASSNSLMMRVSHLCKDCYRTFKDINNYKEHRFQEHQEKYTNVRQCSMCSYATLLKSKYDCHMRCHLNNKVIKCQRCNYSTINIRHMSKHERMHMINNQNLASLKSSSSSPTSSSTSTLASPQTSSPIQKTQQESNQSKRKTDINDASYTPDSKIQKMSSSIQQSTPVANTNCNTIQSPKQSSNLFNNNSNILEVIDKKIEKNINRDEYKENHYDNNQILNNIHSIPIINNNNQNNFQFHLNLLTHALTNQSSFAPYAMPIVSLLRKSEIPMINDSANIAYLNSTMNSYNFNNPLNKHNNPVNSVTDNNNANTTTTSSINADFPKNKYEKFLSNYNNMTKLGSSSNNVNNTNPNTESSNDIKTSVEKQNRNELKQKSTISLNLKKLRFKYSKVEKQFRCELCEYKTKQKANLIPHSKKHNSTIEANVLIKNTIDDTALYKRKNSNLNGSHTNQTSNNNNTVSFSNINKLEIDTNSKLLIEQPATNSHLSNIQTQIFSPYLHEIPNIQHNRLPELTQHMIEALRCQYPLLSPTYAASLLALQQQQQQQQHANAAMLQFPSYQSVKFEIDNKQEAMNKNSYEPVINQIRTQQAEPSKEQINTNKSKNTYRIEDLCNKKETKNSVDSETSNVDLAKKQQVEIKINSSIQALDSSKSNNNNNNNNNNNIDNNNNKCCDHKKELYLLRQNVYKMLYKNLPNVLLAFNLLNDPLSPQIDFILQSLLLNAQDHNSIANTSVNKINETVESKYFNLNNNYSINKSAMCQTTTSSSF